MKPSGNGLPTLIRRHLTPGRGGCADAGDRFDLMWLGAIAALLIVAGGNLDALSLEAIVGRTVVVVYLSVLVALGVASLIVRSRLCIGRLLQVAGAVVITLSVAAFMVRGIDAFLPAAVYLVAGRRLVTRAAELIDRTPSE